MGSRVGALNRPRIDRATRSRTVGLLERLPNSHIQHDKPIEALCQVHNPDNLRWDQLLSVGINRRLSMGDSYGLRLPLWFVPVRLRLLLRWDGCSWR